MVAIALALAASCCWGIADFTGGLKSRHLPVPLVLLVVEGTGALAVALVIAATHEPLPDTRSVVFSLVAGTAGILGLAGFYRALAIGTMSIVAPISATGSAVPVIVGLASGERPGAVQLVGIVAAGVGVVLASREAPHEDEARARAGRASIALALVAALGFGAFFVGMDRAADADVLWALLAARIAGNLGLLAFVLLARPRLELPATALPALAAVGALDLAANGLYAWGTTEGLLSVVAVLASLYPVATVLLARGVLGERIRRVQEVGVVTALAGVVLIAAG
jgi:drug/metabolite transporter (DMT)-like permease